ncbi:MAG TPA: hypothetical protein VGR82_13135 [Methylomirabilota bacterium]|nr:hypothetical protein [Methylomirabilota bacterium]
MLALRPVTASVRRLKRKGVRLTKDVHETAWGTREFALKDDQGHTLYVGARVTASTAA